MVWINEAVKRGIDQAHASKQKDDEAETDRRAFENEQVTEEKIIEFLWPYLPIMTKIIADLEANQFRVEDSGMGYYPIISSIRHFHSLVREFPSETKGVNYYKAYGRAWNIFTSDGHRLGEVRFFPKADGKTHFAFVQMETDTGAGRYFESTDDAGTTKAVEELQGIIGGWIADHQQKQERRLL